MVPGAAIKCLCRDADTSVTSTCVGGLVVVLHQRNGQTRKKCYHFLVFERRRVRWLAGETITVCGVSGTVCGGTAGGESNSGGGSVVGEHGRWRHDRHRLHSTYSKRKSIGRGHHSKRLFPRHRAGDCLWVKSFERRCRKVAAAWHPTALADGP